MRVVTTVSSIVSSTSFGGGLTGLVLFVLFVVAPLASFFSAVLTPSSRFRAVGKSKALWVILPYLLGFFAAGYYFAFVRPQLRRR